MEKPAMEKIAMEKTTRSLLAQYTSLLNRFGINSREAEDFIDANRGNGEFVQLAALSRTLKEALTAPAQNCRKESDAL